MADVGGISLHFAHVPGVRSSGQAKPLPLILTHGWPSSFVEMMPLVPLLTDPGKHGADPANAFDVVIPSLPGFMFSTLPAQGHVTHSWIADVWVQLMTEVLGYAKFGAFGGDVGARVTHFLAARHPEHMIGIHLTDPATRTSPDPTRPFTPAEQAYVDWLATYDEMDSGYSAIQTTRPDTLAAGLIDSPAGLAAWIVDKYRVAAWLQERH